MTTTEVSEVSPPESDPAIPPAVDDTITGQDILNGLKQGWKTSEFWLTVLGGAVTTFLLVWDRSKPFSEQVTAITPLVGASLWAGFRTWLKTRRIKAIASIVGS